MEEVENENEHRRSKDRSPSPAIKSTAVVKYTAFQSPVTYAQLQCNTDLNLPPSNYGAAIDSYGLKQILTSQPGMSSFRMAHMFPDCVGEVDVIAGAEVIKKLLKLPYQPNGTVSMMVHRVENTLLLDDFDVYDYLMKSEWSWLKDFFYENILKTMSEQERMSLTMAPVSPSALQLTNKFLSHSLAQTPARLLKPHVDTPTLTGPFLPEPETKPEEPNEHLYNRNVHWTFEDIHMLIGSDLPIFGDKDRPCVSLRLRDAREPINVLTGIDYWLDNLMCNVPEVLMCYHLDGIVQKYEPMKTEDLPNMENSNFSPKVIRNVAQNILSFLKSNATKAGHTYWLFKGPHDDVVKLYDLTSLCPDDIDNPTNIINAKVIRNVAQNILSFLKSNATKAGHTYWLFKGPHDDVVKLYDLTSLCPVDIDNPTNIINAKVIRNVAQNILSFLKSNATKAGHTYWLFKGPHDDVVKLYDLTSLCPDDVDNPFTTPVAMLLYRVARNMRLTNRTKHVRRVLEHVVTLLQAARYPQIVASSHYMLSDLYVPATTNPATPDFKDESSDSEGEDLEYEFECERDDTQDVTSEQDKEEEIIIESERDSHESNRESSNDLNEKEGSSDSKGDGNSENNTSERDSNTELSKIENALAVQIRGLSMRDIGDRIRTNLGSSKRPRSPRTSESVSGRCGRALAHAIKGLLSLHHVTIDKCMEEERERLRQQIIIEEQHPKMANPYEPIKMDYEPIKQDSKENSRSRRRKRERKTSKENYIVDTNKNIDSNAILIRKEKNFFPSFHEPNRDDNFAWKLHLKTLLYEKICLAYATLAEFSYANKQYGFSLKYIDMASKCQKLLSNMIIKSKVVDSSCLIGRVGDNYFQLSKNWAKLEQFKKQFETDHDIDATFRVEIERDLAEEVDNLVNDEFDLDIELPTSELQAMLKSCEQYNRAADVAQGRRAELLRRRASVHNELAVKYMNDAQQTYIKYTEEEDQKSTKANHLYTQFKTLSRKSLECLNEAMEIFRTVSDQPNLALLFCNKGRFLRFKAHCDQSSGFGSEKRSLYNQAEELYKQALKLLGGRESSAASIWELVCWELSCHLYTKAVLMQDDPGPYALEVSEVSEALKQALKQCQLGAGPRQYLYQFRAAMIHHRLASLYHSQYRITNEDGPKRRTLLNATQTNYTRAANMFASLEDVGMFLTVQMEHVALFETIAQGIFFKTTAPNVVHLLNATQTNYTRAANMFASLEDVGMFLTVQMEHVALFETIAQVSPNLKLKSYQNAIQLLRQCLSIMQLLNERDAEDKEKDEKTEDQKKEDDKSIKSEYSLLILFENRLHFILKSVIQYCRSKSNKDYEKMTDMHKKLYCASLKIKKCDDLKVYAASICDVLIAMDDITKEFE